MSAVFGEVLEVVERRFAGFGYEMERATGTSMTCSAS